MHLTIFNRSSFGTNLISVGLIIEYQYIFLCFAEQGTTYSLFFLTQTICFISGCPKVTYLSEYSGTFSSPNHKDFYPDNQQCTWYITAPHASLHVKLSFNNFHLEDCKNCECDSLTVYDVTKDKRNVTLGTFCGNRNPGTLYSSGRYMIVVFKSDNGDSQSGFLANYFTNVQQGSGKKKRCSLNFSNMCRKTAWNHNTPIYTG